MIIDPATQVPIGIGELAVLKEPKVITTVLGSCVSVCLYAPAHRAGGMNHFAMPKKISGAQGYNQYHFGNDAIPALVEKLKQLTGAQAADFVAKIVGGAQGLSGSSGSVGKENIALALAMLRQYEIKVIGTDTGGNLGRKVLFYPESGRLLVALLDARAAA